MANLEFYNPGTPYTDMNLRDTSTIQKQRFVIEFPVGGNAVSTLQVKCKQVGAIGAGNVWCVAKDSIGATLGTSDLITASTVAGAYATLTFTFTESFSSPFDQIDFEIDADYAINGTDYLAFGGDGTGSGPDGQSEGYDGGAWNPLSNSHWYQLTGETPLVSFDGSALIGRYDIVLDSTGNALRGRYDIVLDSTGNALRGTYGINVNFTGNVLRGKFRQPDSNLDRYEIFVGTDADPDPTAAPDETFTSLPHTTTLTFADGATHNILVRDRNQWNLSSQNVFNPNNDGTGGYTFTVDGAGDLDATKPSDPYNVALTQAASGAVKVSAFYNYLEDGDNAATKFLVYLTNNGVDPVPGVDSPTEVDFTQADGLAKLTYTSATQTDGATIKVIVQVRRVDSGPVNVDSSDATVYTILADDSAPAAPDATATANSLSQEQ
jgi:hypothetical protein